MLTLKRRRRENIQFIMSWCFYNVRQCETAESALGLRMILRWRHDAMTTQWLNIRRLQGHVSAATHPSSCHMTSVMPIVTPSRRILPGNITRQKQPWAEWSLTTPRGWHQPDRTSDCFQTHHWRRTEEDLRHEDRPPAHYATQSFERRSSVTHVFEPVFRPPPWVAIVCSTTPARHRCPSTASDDRLHWNRATVRQPRCHSTITTQHLSQPLSELADISIAAG